MIIVLANNTEFMSISKIKGGNQLKNSAECTSQMLGCYGMPPAEKKWYLTTDSICHISAYMARMRLHQ